MDEGQMNEMHISQLHEHDLLTRIHKHACHIRQKQLQPLR
jgi:hypothetical protein